MISQGASLRSPSGFCDECEPLIEPLRYQRPDVARFLIEKGTKLNGMTCTQHSYRGYTALHYCAQHNYGLVLHDILDRCPGLLFASSDVHPIYIAIINDSNDCLRIMLDRSAEAWRISVGTTTLSNAVPEKMEGDTDLWRVTARPGNSSELSLLKSAGLTLVSLNAPTFVWQLSEERTRETLP